MDSTRLKLKVEVTDNGAAIQQPMPPPSGEWNNQYSSPDGDDAGPFVEQLLPYVRASAYNWFHLQAAKRRYHKEFDKKMTMADEKTKMLELESDRDEAKVRWASRLLGKIKKDIQNEHKEAFVLAISGERPSDCILSVGDQKGKIRRIDCLRQADKVWRLDLVTIILFKGIPLESTDGERLERIESCTNPLCINPFHLSVSVRTLDIFLSSYLKDVDTRIREGSGSSKKEDGIVVKLEPGTSHPENQNLSWKADAPQMAREYDPQRACHSYFGGRAMCVSQGSSTHYSYSNNRDAIDNNFFCDKRSVLCLPPPPQGLRPLPDCVDFPEVGGSSDSQQNSEDSNDEPLEKRSRDLSSHGSPNSSTNDEIRRIVETGEKRGIILGERSTIWSPVGGNSLIHQRQMRHVNGDYLNEPPRERELPYRTVAKPVRRMTVNAGNHGDVGVIVVDARTQNIMNSPTFILDNSLRMANGNLNGVPVRTQTIHSAINGRLPSPGRVLNTPGRKRTHADSPVPLSVLSEDSVNEVFSSVAAAAAALVARSGCDVSPPHPNVTDLMSRPEGEATDSPTKFTTARGDIISFRNAMEKVEKLHEASEQQAREQQMKENGMNGEHATNMQALRNGHIDTRLSPTYSAALAAAQLKPAFITTKIQHGLPAPVAIKPAMIPMSACSSIRASPIDPAYRHITEGEGNAFAIRLSGALGLTTKDNFISYLAGESSESPIPTNGTGGAFTSVVLPNRPESSADNPSTSLQEVMGLITSPLALAAAALSPLHRMRAIANCSPSSSDNSSSANQAPITNAPLDPNAPKPPTDFAQAMSIEKK